MRLHRLEKLTSHQSQTHHPRPPVQAHSNHPCVCPLHAHSHFQCHSHKVRNDVLALEGRTGYPQTVFLVATVHLLIPNHSLKHFRKTKQLSQVESKVLFLKEKISF